MGIIKRKKKGDGSWTASQRLQRQATCSLVIYIGVDVHRSPQNNLDSVENHCNVLVIPGRLERLATRNATDGRRAGGRTGAGAGGWRREERIFQDGSRFAEDDNLVQGSSSSANNGRRTDLGQKIG